MKKILYVEDDPINALVVKKLLQSDFDVSHSIDGESCLELIAEAAFDLILMDIHLGKDKMDGVETMQKVKQLPAYADVPIIVVTSYAMPEDKARFLSKGFDYYFEKPIDRTALINQIKIMLQIKEAM